MMTRATVLGRVVLVGLLSFPAIGGQSGPDRAALESRFREGGSEFAAGLDLATRDQAAAREHFAKAAAAWRTIVTDGGVRNPDLERNIGNASLLAGDAPRAIAAFRRARTIDPNDAAAANGLAAARRAAGTEASAPGSASSPAGDTGESGWRGGAASLWRWIGGALEQLVSVLSPRWLLWVAAICYVGAAGLALLRIRGHRPVARWMPSALLAGSLLAAAPLVVSDLSRMRRHEAVVVAPGVTARQGPAEMYEPTFKEPLTPGLEVVIVEERGEWVLVRLHDARTAWVRSAVLERL